jgi:hypothetical protein
MIILCYYVRRCIKRRPVRGCKLRGRLLEMCNDGVASYQNSYLWVAGGNQQNILPEKLAYGRCTKDQ